jgi:hypothetical protein
MFQKLRKASEAVGHVGNAWTFAGFLGWQTKLAAFGAGMVTWAATFFGSASEGLSATAVWVASLAAGVLVALLVLIVAIIFTVVRRREEPIVGSAVTVNAEVIRAPKYNRAQIGRIIEAIDVFYPIVLDINRDLEFGDGIAKSMESLILHNGAQHYLGQMDVLRLKLNDTLGRLQKTNEEQGLYQEACRIVSDSTNFSDPFYASWNELAGILRDIPDNLNARSLSIFIGAKKETFITRVSEFYEWSKQKKLALIHHRAHYLKIPTSD